MIKVRIKKTKLKGKRWRITKDAGRVQTAVVIQQPIGKRKRFSGAEVQCKVIYNWIGSQKTVQTIKPGNIESTQWFTQDKSR